MIHICSSVTKSRCFFFHTYMTLSNFHSSPGVMIGASGSWTRVPGQGLSTMTSPSRWHFMTSLNRKTSDFLVVHSAKRLLFSNLSAPVCACDEGGWGLGWGGGSAHVSPPANSSQTKQTPSGWMDVTSVSPSAPESETSKMPPVSSASLILQV